jgi:putative ABC transport system permease protein
MVLVALGAAVLAGFQSAAPSMLQTMSGYLEDRNLSDYRLFCDMGITAADVEALAAQPGVLEVEPGYAVNISARHNEEVLVYALLSLPDEVCNGEAHDPQTGISRLKLTAGRMPLAQGECVADADSALVVGDVVTFNGENDPTSLDLVSQTMLTVVGKARTPLYISNTRGSATIGSGRVSGFLYVPASTFTSDYYTVIGLRLADTAGVPSFSDEYTGVIDRKYASLEAFCQQRAKVRQNEMRQAVNEQVDSAAGEIDSARSEADKELADAREKLSAAQDEIHSGEEAYQKGVSDLEQAKRELDESERELKAAKKALDDGWATYDAGNKQLAGAKQALGQLESQRDALIAAMTGETNPAVLAQIQAQLEALVPQIGGLQQQIVASERELLASRGQLEQKDAEYASGMEKYRKAAEEIDENERKLSSSRSELDRSKSALEQGESSYQNQSEEANTAIEALQADLDSARKVVSEIGPPTWLLQARSELPGFSDFKSNAERITMLSLVIPYFFFVIAALVCLTTMARMVEEQRSQIGTLKALGFTEDAIGSMYQFFPWAMGLPGGVIGVALGVLVIPRLIWSMYVSNYPVNGFELVPAVIPCIIGLLGGAVVIAVVTYFACRSSLYSSASVLMRPGSPRAGSRVFLERVGIVWRRIGFKGRVTLRNLIRYKKRLVMTITGVTGSVALLVTVFGVLDSIGSVAQVQFGEIAHYEAAFTLREPSSSSADTELNRRLSDYESAYAFASGLEASANGRSSAGFITYLYVVEDSEAIKGFLTFRERNGHAPLEFPPPPPPKLVMEADGAQGASADADIDSLPRAVISERLSRVLGVGVGDVVHCERTGQPAKDLVVSGVMENYLYNFVFITPEDFYALYGEDPPYATVLLKADLTDSELDALTAELLKTKMIALSQPVSMLETLVDEVTENMLYVVWFMVAVCCVLTFVVLYNLVNLNITERMRELATLKVIGYYQREVAGYIYREVAILMLIGLALGLVGGVFLHEFVMGTLDMGELMFTRVIRPQSFMLAALFTVLCSALLFVAMLPRLRRIDPVTSLKSVE